MNSEQWEATHRYLASVFGPDKGDARLASLSERASLAGIPAIAVSPEVARLLMVLARIATGDQGATGRVLEIGTLAGYSGIHLARGLGVGGTLMTIEAEPMHAAFARGEFEGAGVGARVEIIEGRALEVLPGLAAQLGTASLDMVFVDAVKREYGDYLELVTPMLRPGGLLCVDNALGAGWWITDAAGDADRDAMDAFNRAMASDARFDAACALTSNGLIVARKR